MRSYADPMAESRVTLQDVADEAGLSKAAASYALRGLKGSAETQERVRDVADRLGYIAHPAAQALAGGRTGAVGVCGALGDLWHQELTVRLAGRLRTGGLASSIADTGADPETERVVVQAMVADRLDGVIALVSDPGAAWWLELPDEFAVVAVGDVLTGRPAASCVVFDNVRGVMTGLEHLTGLGHRRIALLTTSVPASPGRPADALAADFADRHDIELTVLPVPPPRRGVRSPVHELLGAPRAPTALFCLSDSIAFGAYRAAGDLGLSVPEDVSILGYDDHDLADLVVPALTTFSWDKDAIVEAAIGHLIDAVEGRPAGRTAFRPDFLERASTAAPL